MIWILRLILSLSLFSILTGIIFQCFGLDDLWMARLYGGGTLGLFFVWMPLFLIYRLQKTRLLDLAEENRDDWEEKIKNSNL